MCDIVKDLRTIEFRLLQADDRSGGFQRSTGCSKLQVFCMNASMAVAGRRIVQYCIMDYGVVGKGVLSRCENFQWLGDHLRRKLGRKN